MRSKLEVNGLKKLIAQYQWQQKKLLGDEVIGGRQEGARKLLLLFFDGVGKVGMT